MADVWSCGVTLYVMLVGGYPFEDPDDPKNFRKTIGRIRSVEYKIPDHVHISEECKQIISRIFVANPAKRITIKEIKSHPWFLKNLPKELREAAQAVYFKKDNNSSTFSPQTINDITKIVNEARIVPSSSPPVPEFTEEDEGQGGEKEEKEKDEEDDYDKQVKEVHASGEYEFVEKPLPEKGEKSN